MTRPRPASALLLAVALAAPSALRSGEPGARRSVVLLLADGAGFNTWKAASLYRGTRGAEFYDSPGWIRLAVSTYPLRSAAEPPVSADLGPTQVPSFVYDPRQAWDPTPLAGGSGSFPYYFAGYKWLRDTRPDSANTMTAIVTGTKSYNGSVNVDGGGRPIERTLASVAKGLGKRVGIVTDVPFSHATPAAAAGAHQADRAAYCPIAIEILTVADLDLLAGAGNPDFDNNGSPIADGERREYSYVGGEAVWAMLTGRRELHAGDRMCTENEEETVVLDDARVESLRRWTLVQSADEIAKLAGKRAPSPLLVVPTVGEVSLSKGHPAEAAAVAHGAAPEPERARVGATLQQQRGSRADPHFTPPGYDPPVAGVPTLAALTRIALDALAGERGFFLMVEGGAIDWAMHENQMGRMIEETLAFDEAVRTAASWVDARSAWADTLLVVVSDHDHLLWGPRSDTVPFDPLQDNGTGKVPSYRWLSDGHSNSLVPLYARGAGAERFEALADHEDPFYGPYLDQTEIFRVLEAALADPSSAP